MAIKPRSWHELHERFEGPSSTSFCACLTNAHAARWDPADWPAKNTLCSRTKHSLRVQIKPQWKEVVQRLPKFAVDHKELLQYIPFHLWKFFYHLILSQIKLPCRKFNPKHIHKKSICLCFWPVWITTKVCDVLENIAYSSRDICHHVTNRALGKIPAFSHSTEPTDPWLEQLSTQQENCSQSIKKWFPISFLEARRTPLMKIEGGAPVIKAYHNDVMVRKLLPQ